MERKSVLLRDALNAAFKKIEGACENKYRNRVIGSGFRGINFRPASLILIRGELSSTYALNLAIQISRSGESVIYFTKDNVSDISIRLLSAETGIPIDKLVNGAVERADWHQLTCASGRLSEALIEFSYAENIFRVVKILEEMDSTPEIIILDTLSLLREVDPILWTVLGLN